MAIAGEARTLIMRWVGLRECPARIWGSSLSIVIAGNSRTAGGNPLPATQPLLRRRLRRHLSLWRQRQSRLFSCRSPPLPHSPQPPPSHPSNTPRTCAQMSDSTQLRSLAELKPHWLLRLSPIRSANTPLTTLIMHIILAAIYMRMVIHMQYTCA